MLPFLLAGIFTAAYAGEKANAGIKGEEEIMHGGPGGRSSGASFLSNKGVRGEEEIIFGSHSRAPSIQGASRGRGR